MIRFLPDVVPEAGCLILVPHQQMGPFPIKIALFNRVVFSIGLFGLYTGLIPLPRQV